jgi:hypothetical protein
MSRGMDEVVAEIVPNTQPANNPIRINSLQDMVIPL